MSDQIKDLPAATELEATDLFHVQKSILGTFRDRKMTKEVVSGILRPSKTVDVVDSTARLALTTATVRAGDFVREVGRAEISKLTCLGSTYTAAVAEVTTVTCSADAGGSLDGRYFVLFQPSPGIPIVVWIDVFAGAGIPSENGVEGVDVYYIAVPISADDADTVVAEAMATAINAHATLNATHSGATVTITHATAGAVDDAMDVDLGFPVVVTTSGADATHTLEGDTLTVYNGSNVARTVGFSLAGNVGDIAVMLPASTRTAAQVAALAQAAIHAHADFTAVQGTGGATAEVTVTCADLGWTRNADAGTTGFTVTTLTQGITGAFVYQLVHEASIATEAGWKALPTFVGFSASNSTGSNQTLTSATHTKLNFVTSDFDSHGQFDATLKRFICRVPGKYAVSAQIDLGSATSGVNRKILQVYKNGSAFKRFVDIPITTSSGNDHIIDGTGVVFDLAVGDYLEVYAYASAGGTVYFDSSIRSFFQATRL